MRNPGILLGIGLNATAVVLDYKTTRHCIDTHRGKEGNPILGQSRAQQLSVGMGAAALGYVLAGKMKKQGGGNWAFGILWLGTVLHGGAAAYNWAGCHG